MMKIDFAMNEETFDELETLAAKMEQLRNYVDFVNTFVWQKVIEGGTGEGINKLACLMETLSDITHLRDKELEAVVLKIKPVHTTPDEEHQEG